MDTVKTLAQEQQEWDETPVAVLPSGKCYHAALNRPFRATALAPLYETVCHFGWPVANPLITRAEATALGLDPCSKCRRKGYLRTYSRPT